MKEVTSDSERMFITFCGFNEIFDEMQLCHKQAAEVYQCHASSIFRSLLLPMAHNYTNGNAMKVNNCFNLWNTSWALSYA